MVNCKPKRNGGGDFQRAKQKVGKRKQFSVNHTDTRFKSRQISVPTQLNRAPKSESQSDGDIARTCAELLAKTRHYNAKDRIQTLCSLRHLAIRHPSLSSSIVKVVARLVIDDDHGVRKSLVAVLRETVKETAAPFLDQLSRFCLAALTHPSIACRLDSLIALDTILDLAPWSINPIRDLLLTALIAILRERASSNVLGSSNRSESGRPCVVLRCLHGLLVPCLATVVAPSPDQLYSPAHLSLLHSPDPFLAPSPVPAHISPALLHQVAELLIECAIECSSSPVNLLECLRALSLSITSSLSDPIISHILPLFSRPSPATKVAICRIMIGLGSALDPDMISFIARSLSSSSNLDDLLSLIASLSESDHLPDSLFRAFSDFFAGLPSGSSHIAPSLPILRYRLSSCSHLLSSLSSHLPDHADHILPLLLDGSRLYSLPIDPVGLLSNLPTLPARLQQLAVSVLGYSHIDSGSMQFISTILRSSSVSLSSRSLLLDMVMDLEHIAIDLRLSLVLTCSTQSDLLSCLRSCLSRLHLHFSTLFDSFYPALVHQLDSRPFSINLLHLAAQCLPHIAGRLHPQLRQFVFPSWKLDPELVSSLLTVSPSLTSSTLDLMLESCSPDTILCLIADPALLRPWRKFPEKVSAIYDVARNSGMFTTEQMDCLKVEIDIICSQIS